LSAHGARFAVILALLNFVDAIEPHAVLWLR
jgi:hypothetical protein